MSENNKTVSEEAVEKFNKLLMQHDNDFKEIVWTYLKLKNFEFLQRFEEDAKLFSRERFLFFISNHRYEEAEKYLKKFVHLENLEARVMIISLKQARILQHLQKNQREQCFSIVSELFNEMGETPICQRLFNMVTQIFDDEKTEYEQQSVGEFAVLLDKISLKAFDGKISADNKVMSMITSGQAAPKGRSVQGSKLPIPVSEIEGLIRSRKSSLTSSPANSTAGSAVDSAAPQNANNVARAPSQNQNGTTITPAVEASASVGQKRPRSQTEESSPDDMEIDDKLSTSKPEIKKLKPTPVPASSLTGILVASITIKGFEWKSMDVGSKRTIIMGNAKGTAVMAFPRRNQTVTIPSPPKFTPEQVIVSWIDQDRAMLVYPENKSIRMVSSTGQELLLTSFNTKVLDAVPVRLVSGISFIVSTDDKKLHLVSESNERHTVDVPKNIRCLSTSSLLRNATVLGSSGDGTVFLIKESQAKLEKVQKIVEVSEVEARQEMSGKFAFYEGTWYSAGSLYLTQWELGNALVKKTRIATMEKQSLSRVDPVAGQGFIFVYDGRFYVYGYSATPGSGNYKNFMLDNYMGYSFHKKTLALGSSSVIKFYKYMEGLKVDTPETVTLEVKIEERPKPAVPASAPSPVAQAPQPAPQPVTSVPTPSPAPVPTPTPAVQPAAPAPTPAPTPARPSAPQPTSAAVNPAPSPSQPTSTQQSTTQPQHRITPGFVGSSAPAAPSKTTQAPAPAVPQPKASTTPQASGLPLKSETASVATLPATPRYIVEMSTISIESGLSNRDISYVGYNNQKNGYAVLCTPEPFFVLFQEIEGGPIVKLDLDKPLTNHLPNSHPATAPKPFFAFTPNDTYCTVCYPGASGGVALLQRKKNTKNATSKSSFYWKIHGRVNIASTELTSITYHPKDNNCWIVTNDKKLSIYRYNHSSPIELYSLEFAEPCIKVVARTDPSATPQTATFVFLLVLLKSGKVQLVTLPADTTFDKSKLQQQSNVAVSDIPAASSTAVTPSILLRKAQADALENAPQKEVLVHHPDRLFIYSFAERRVIAHFSTSTIGANLTILATCFSGDGNFVFAALSNGQLLILNALKLTIVDTRKADIIETMDARYIPKTNEHVILAGGMKQLSRHVLKIKQQ